jgi:O-antigen ligase
MNHQRQSMQISFLLFIFALYYAPIINHYVPPTRFGFGLPDFGFQEIILILWASSSFFELLVGWLKYRVRSFWIVILAFYTSVVLISVAWSNESYSSGTIRDLFYHVLVPLLFAFFATYYARHEKYRATLIKNAALGCMLLSVMGALNFIFHFGGNIDKMRSAASFDNPNALAIFLVMNIPVILYGLDRQAINKIFGLLALCVIVMGVFSTISRKGIVTAGMSIIIFLFLTRNYRLLIPILLICFPLALCSFAIKPIAQRFESIKIEGQFKGKWNMTMIGWDMFRKNPVIGLGYKGYYNNFGKYYKNSGKRRYDAHNEFITALANYGIIGGVAFLGIFLWPLGRSFLMLLRLKKKAFDNERAKFAAGIAIVVPFMFNAWFAGELMYFAGVTIVLFSLIAMFCIPNPRQLVDIMSTQ